MKTNSLAKIADRFFEECSRIQFTDKSTVVDLTPVMKVLSHLRVDENYTIECLTPGNEGMGGETVIYARKRGEKRPDMKDIREYGNEMRWADDNGRKIACEMDPANWVTVDGSPESIWEYHLFLDMWRFLPLWWHANYAEVRYITDADALLDLTKITPEIVEQYYSEGGRFAPGVKMPYGFDRESDIVNAISLCGDESLLPVVRNEGELVETVYCYWSEWGGLVRSRIQSVVLEGKVLIIGKSHNTRLVNYECGIMF